MAEISAKIQAARIEGFLRGFKATHLINIGAKLGVFQALGEASQGMTVAELVSKLRLHEPYLRVWCQTAYHFEILDCDEQGRFRLQPFMDEVLGSTSSPGSILGRVDMTVNIAGERLRNSPDYYRTGKIMDDNTPERSEMIAEATRMLHRAIIDGPWPMLAPDSPIRQKLEQGARMLDIGCGRGGFITRLAQSFVSSSFLGVDPVSHGIEQGKGAIALLGLEERVCLEHSGGEEIRYRDEFDVVSMVLVFHEILPDVRAKALQGACQALKKGGMLWLLDFAYPEALEDFRNPLFTPGVIDQFDESCTGAVLLGARRQSAVFSDAGFSNIQRKSIGAFDIVTAEK